MTRALKSTGLFGGLPFGGADLCVAIVKKWGDEAETTFSMSLLRLKDGTTEWTIKIKKGICQQNYATESRWVWCPRRSGSVANS